MGRWIVTFDSRSATDVEGMEMRGLLKVALRRFGMRCVEARREERAREQGERRELLAEALKRELAERVKKFAGKK